MPKKALKENRDVEILQMVKDRYNSSKNMNQDDFMRAVDNEQLYFNYIDETQNPYISNISLPWPYIIVESYLGKCIQTTAAMMPYVHVVEEEAENKAKARRVEKDANMVLYRHRWPIFCYNTYKQAFKYGTAFILEKPWGELKGEEMPLLSLLNFFHCYPSPTVLDLDDKDAYFIYETFIPKRLLENYKGNSFYKNIDKIQTYEGDIYTQEERTIHAFKNINSPKQDRYSELVKCIFYWSHQDMIIITNDTNVIRDDQENFLGRIPVKVITPIPLENSFYGMSILEEGKDLFAECNENRNQFNDAANLMLNPQYIVNRDAAQLKRTTITSKAGNIIFTDDVNAIVTQKQDWNLLLMCLKRQDAIYQDIMNYSNAFPQMRGGSIGGGKQTATEYQGMRMAGELRSDTYNLLLAMMGVESIVEDIVEFKRMFMTDPSKFFYWPDQKPAIVQPEDYQAKFTFKAFSGFKQMQEIERKQLLEAMTLVFGGAGGAFLPYVMPRAQEWLERIIDSYPEIRSPEQLMLTEQEKMIADQQAQMQQLMQMMGQMGGGKGDQKQIAMGEKEHRMPENEPNNEMGNMLRNVSPVA